MHLIKACAAISAGLRNSADGQQISLCCVCYPHEDICVYVHLHIAAQAAIGTSALEHRNSLLNRAFVSETDNSKQDRLFQAVRMSAVPKSKSRFVE